MNISVHQSLNSLSISSLNFTGNCKNVALGYEVWYNDFFSQSPTPGNLTGTPNPSDNGPSGTGNVWLNGTSPEFIQFWRDMLPPNQTTKDFSDNDIVSWTNSTPFYEFFIDDLGTAWPRPDNIDQLSNSLAQSGGCKNNNSQDVGDVKQYSQFQQVCMINYCCSSGSDTDSQKPYPYFPTNWTVSSACAFDTCQHANKGNPDLGGIGIIVAYFIEATLLFLSLIAFGIKLITDSVYRKQGKTMPRVLAQHDAATIAGAGVFLDNAVFFSFSINFASIIFNYHAQPLLYEDKLGQTSSLLGIDAPVAIALMSYHVIDRRMLRTILVLSVALMTFIIQLMFRKSKSFDPQTSLCLDWKEDLQSSFVARFIAKAVWAGLVFLFFAWNSVRWGWVFARRREPNVASRSRKGWWQRTVNQIASGKVSRFMASIHQKLPWRRLIAYILATYGLFAIIIDIQFVLYLRVQESSIASEDNEDQWGYGQILAVFVWVPVYLEYIYIFGFQRTFWGKYNRNAENIAAERRSYEMSEYVSHRVPIQK